MVKVQGVGKVGDTYTPWPDDWGVVNVNQHCVVVRCEMSSVGRPLCLSTAFKEQVWCCYGGDDDNDDDDDDNNNNNNNNNSTIKTVSLTFCITKDGKSEIK